MILLIINLILLITVIACSVRFASLSILKFLLAQNNLSKSLGFVTYSLCSLKAAAEHPKIQLKAFTGLVRLKNVNPRKMSGKIRKTPYKFNKKILVSQV